MFRDSINISRPIIFSIWWYFTVLGVSSAYVTSIKLGVYLLSICITINHFFNVKLHLYNGDANASDSCFVIPLSDH